MTIATGDQREFHEFARLVAPPLAAVPQPTPQPQPKPTSARHDDLEEQVKQLREEVRKEASRADRAQGVVRILENRLGIDAGRGQPADQKK